MSRSDRTIVALLGFFALLLGAFILTPTTKVDPRVGRYTAGYTMDARDTRPEKSGLRVAVEGRLRWLGF